VNAKRRGVADHYFPAISSIASPPPEARYRITGFSDSRLDRSMEPYARQAMFKRTRSPIGSHFPGRLATSREQVTRVDGPYAHNFTCPIFQFAGPRQPSRIFTFALRRMAQPEMKGKGLKGEALRGAAGGRPALNGNSNGLFGLLEPRSHGWSSDPIPFSPKDAPASPRLVER